MFVYGILTVTVLILVVDSFFHVLSTFWFGAVGGVFILALLHITIKRAVKEAIIETRQQ
jgi:membrane associated rhomboid family serine protease